MNNRQVQVSANINNINLPHRQQSRQHVRNPQRIAADMVMDESSDDDDDDDDHEDSEHDDESGDTDDTTTDEDDDKKKKTKKSHDANVPVPTTTDQQDDIPTTHD